MPETYHIELPCIGPSSVISTLREADSIVGFRVSKRREFSYTDTYWDTERFDLHGSAISIRSRRRDKEDDFISFKGPPTYLAPFVFGRPLVSEAVDGSADAHCRLSLTVPSQVMTGLYGTRPDLVGRPLGKVAAAFVQRVNVDLLDKSGQGVCTASFHSYNLTVKDEEAGAGILMELQPYCRAPIVADALLQMFRLMVPRLEQAGLRPSPVGKYHRITRAALEV